MRLTTSASRIGTVAVVVAAVLMVSGCGWFRRDNKLYAGDPSTRPLEVPPDLDLPRTDAAMAIPGASATASARPAAGVSTGFNMSGSRDEVFASVGEALAKVDGVTIASRAQALGVYDVGYEGSNFLVRVSAVDAGAYVSAVDPRGQPATGEAATRLMAALKAALGN